MLKIIRVKVITILHSLKAPFPLNVLVKVTFETTLSPSPQ